jgi:hypothetical protein
MGANVEEPFVGEESQCGGFEVPPILAAPSERNFKSKATLESYTC